MMFFRSLLFNLVAIPYSCLVLVFGSFALLLPSNGPTLWVVNCWCRSLMALTRVLLRIDYRIEGLENITGPCVIASKHQSTWETLIFHVLFHNPAMIMKSEIGCTPMSRGFIDRLEQIAVNRRDGARALVKMVQQAGVALDKGRHVVIFPEGTRVAPHQTIPYQKGVAALYKSLQKPVVPLALNSGLFWGRRAFLKRPGTITLRFLPEIPPGLAPEAFMEQLSTALNEATASLCRPDRTTEQGAKNQPQDH